MQTAWENARTEYLALHPHVERVPFEEDVNIYTRIAPLSQRDKLPLVFGATAAGIQGNRYSSVDSLPSVTSQINLSNDIEEAIKKQVDRSMQNTEKMLGEKLTQVQSSITTAIEAAMSRFLLPGQAGQMGLTPPWAASFPYQQWGTQPSVQPSVYRPHFPADFGQPSGHHTTPTHYRSPLEAEPSHRRRADRSDSSWERDVE